MRTRPAIKAVAHESLRVKFMKGIAIIICVEYGGLALTRKRDSREWLMLAQGRSAWSKSSPGGKSAYESR